MLGLAHRGFSLTDYKRHMAHTLRALAWLLRGEYRAQLLVKGTNRRTLREALQAALAARPDLAKRVVVDVDPLSVL